MKDSYRTKVSMIKDGDLVEPKDDLLSKDILNRPHEILANNMDLILSSIDYLSSKLGLDYVTEQEDGAIPLYSNPFTGYVTKFIQNGMTLKEAIVTLDRTIQNLKAIIRTKRYTSPNINPFVLPDGITVVNSVLSPGLPSFKYFPDENANRRTFRTLQARQSPRVYSLLPITSESFLGFGIDPDDKYNYFYAKHANIEQYNSSNPAWKIFSDLNYSISMDSLSHNCASYVKPATDTTPARVYAALPPTTDNSSFNLYTNYDNGYIISDYGSFTKGRGILFGKLKSTGWVWEVKRSTVTSDDGQYRSLILKASKFANKKTLVCWLNYNYTKIGVRHVNRDWIDIIDGAVSSNSFGLQPVDTSSSDITFLKNPANGTTTWYGLTHPSIEQVGNNIIAVFSGKETSGSKWSIYSSYYDMNRDGEAGYTWSKPVKMFKENDLYSYLNPYILFVPATRATLLSYVTDEGTIGNYKHVKLLISYDFGSTFGNKVELYNGDISVNARDKATTTKLIVINGVVYFIGEDYTSDGWKTAKMRLKLVS